MKDYEILGHVEYIENKKGYSMFSGDRVTIWGEDLVKFSDGKIVEWYEYDIDGYTAKNGKHFVALKSNIVVDKEKI